MINIESIGKSLTNDLINSKGNPMYINTIVEKINSFKDSNTGEFINFQIKNEIIEEIGTNILIIDYESATELKKILEKISGRLEENQNTNKENRRKRIN